MSHLRHIPSFQSGLARCADECLYPTLWDRLTAWWDPGVGPTGTVLKNYSAHGAVFDGVFAGANLPSWQLVDSLGWVLRYSGAGDCRVSLSTDTRLQLTSGGTWTVAGWVRPAEAAADGVVYSKHDDLGALGVRGSSLYWTNNNVVTAYGNTTWNKAYSDAVFTDSQAWCHTAAVCEGSSVTFYRNGVHAGSHGNSSWTDNGTAIACIGCMSKGWHEFEGDIGPLGLWAQRALKPADVMLLATDPHALVRLAG